MPPLDGMTKPVRSGLLVGLALLGLATPSRADDLASVPDPVRRGVAARNSSLVACLAPVALGAALYPSAEGSGSVLMALGPIFGPSVGFSRAGVADRALLGIGLRLVGAGLILTGLPDRGDPVYTLAGSSSYSEDRSRSFGQPLVLTGTALLVGSLAFDLASIERRVASQPSRTTWSPEIGPARVAVRVSF